MASFSFFLVDEIHPPEEDHFGWKTNGSGMNNIGWETKTPFAFRPAFRGEMLVLGKVSY